MAMRREALEPVPGISTQNHTALEESIHRSAVSPSVFRLQDRHVADLFRGPVSDADILGRCISPIVHLDQAGEGVEGHGTVICS